MQYIKMGKKRAKLNLGDVFIGLVILIGIILIFNIFLAFNLNKGIKENASAAQEKLKPARIEVVFIKNSKCPECFDISQIASHLKSANANITKQSSVEFDTKEGRNMISRYKIQKIPAAVITGDIDKLNIQGLEKRDNALVLANIELPYTDAATGAVEGRVTMYILKDPSCQKCNDLISLISQIKATGVRISEQKNITITSAEGQELVKKYNIGFAPTIILSKDASAYPIIQQAWLQIGSKESDGSYVLRGGIQYPALPFINLSTGRLRGLVDIIYITDKSCPECYDARQHKQILENSFGMKFEKEDTYDIRDATGKELIAKYSIAQVPTAILSDEVGIYPSSQLLKQFYTVEEDSFYVFRNASIVGTYRDLATNEIVKAANIG